MLNRGAAHCRLTQKGHLLEETMAIAASTSQTIVFTDGSPNLQQFHRLDYTTAPANQPATNDYVLEAEIRVVDGETYVTARYVEPGPGEPYIPEGWFVYGDQDAPGLTILGLDPLADQLEVVAVLEMLGNLTLENAGQIFAEHTTAITLEEGELADGTPVERIITTFDVAGANQLWDLFNPDDPVLMLLYEQIESDPLVFTILVDDAGNLVGVDYTIDLVFDPVDISSAVGAAGFTLSGTYRQTLSARITAINAELEQIAAPEGVTSKGLSANWITSTTAIRPPRAIWASPVSGLCLSPTHPVIMATT